MLRRLYAHNFKTLVNFTVEFEEMNLLLGTNGSGKSTILDVLYRLRVFLSEDNPRVEELFPPDDATRWERSQDPYQQFEMTVEENSETYQYTLRIEHSTKEKKSRIGFEELLHEGRPLYQFDTRSKNGAAAKLYHDDYSLGGEFLFDWSRSGVGSLHEKSYNTKLMRFRLSLQSLFVLKFNLPGISSEAPTEDEMPAQDMRNFASWYRYLSQSQPSQVFELTCTLREILPGFDSLSFQAAGESKLLNVEFNHDSGEPISYRFGQLSDGQKALVLLYTLLHCLPRKGVVLCLDEPENFLALPEVQLWLDALEKHVLEGRKQSILISHHPRLINMLAANGGQWFYREGANSPTRVKPVSLDAPDGLSASRLVEMGWLVND